MDLLRNGAGSTIRQLSQKLQAIQNSIVDTYMHCFTLINFKPVTVVQAKQLN